MQFAFMVLVYDDGRRVCHGFGLLGTSRHPHQRSKIVKRLCKTNVIAYHKATPNLGAFLDIFLVDFGRISSSEIGKKHSSDFCPTVIGVKMLKKDPSGLRVNVILAFYTPNLFLFLWFSFSLLRALTRGWIYHANA